ncbi:hypothetical protein BGZ98_008318 [Dissophora globulifera]|nr:hypothetical protein BGZ98_008318 [Dissophora globulifera]
MSFVLNALQRHSPINYGIALIAYMTVVRFFRYRRINALLKKYPDPTLPLRNPTVAKEIFSTFNDYEFPYLNVVSLEFALFKTYAIPSISKILAASKEFNNSCLKRTDDTVFILLEMNEGYSRNLKRSMVEGKVDANEVLNDEKRAEIAIDRLNYIHGHYTIKQEDYLYTLALFMLEPPSFIDQFEWRKSTELEQNALFALWTEQGKAMNIQNIPETKEEMQAWAEEYESKFAVYAPTNGIIADATIALLLSLAPSFTHGFGVQAVSALLTPRLRAAFNIPPPPRGVTTLVRATIRARAAFIRYFMLPRRLPHVRTALRANNESKYVPSYHKYKPVYPDGYRIEDLGPTKYLGKCPVSFHPSGITPSSSAKDAETKAL